MNRINYYNLLSFFNYCVREQVTTLLKTTLLANGQTLWEVNEGFEMNFEQNEYDGFEIVLLNQDKYMNYEQVLEDLESTMLRSWVSEFFGRSRDNIVINKQNVGDWFQVDVPSLKSIREVLIHVN